MKICPSCNQWVPALLTVSVWLPSGAETIRLCAPNCGIYSKPVPMKERLANHPLYAQKTQTERVGGCEAQENQVPS